MTIRRQNVNFTKALCKIRQNPIGKMVSSEKNAEIIQRREICFTNNLKRYNMKNVRASRTEPSLKLVSFAAEVLQGQNR